MVLSLNSASSTPYNETQSSCISNFKRWLNNIGSSLTGREPSLIVREPSLIGRKPYVMINDHSLITASSLLARKLKRHLNDSQRNISNHGTEGVGKS